MQWFIKTGHDVERMNGALRCFLPGVVALLLMSCGVDDADRGEADNGLNDWLDAEYRNDQNKHAADPDMHIERGLLASRKHRYIDLLASATGVGPATPLDIFISVEGNNSSSALAVTTVKPAALQAALEFIGMSAGHPLDSANTHHWPKGERVSITFYWDDPDFGLLNQSARAEHLLMDTRWNTRLPARGFRFVGFSEHGSEEIATAFNATNTVLEVPYIVSRKAIQGWLVVSEEHRFSPGQKLRIRIRPEFRDSRGRVRDFMLDIQAGAGASAEQLQNLAVKLSAPDGQLIVDDNFEAVFVYLQAIIEEGEEPFLQLRFSDSLAAGSVRTIAKFVQSFLIAQDIRIEPNEEHLFYSAFLPRESWRDPQRRGQASQPLEIRLASHSAGELSGEITQHPQAGNSTIAAKQFSFSNEEEFRQAVQGGELWQTDGVFLFVDPNLPYARIRHVYELMRTVFPNFYVFM